MNTIDRPSRLAVEYTLSWSSGTMYHLERYFAEPVSVWRDVLPDGLSAALLGQGEGARAEVAADLNELIALNAKRPYFLLVHVRESNDVNSLVEITKQLEGPVEIVPVDAFLKLAASNKTYTTRYQDPADPKHFKGF